MERIIVWHRWSPTPEPNREAVLLATQWRVSARERFLRADAAVLSELGGSAAFALPASQLLRAVELCLSAVRDAEREDSGAGGVSCGIAIGSVEGVPSDESDDEDGEQGSAETGSVAVGDALDRAQALAHAGGASDVVLDAAAQAAASSTFLFAREVSTPLGVGGAVLDRAFPRRSDCQRTLARLARPPFPLNGQSQFESLRRLAKSSGRHRVLLIGPHGYGIGQWITRIAGELGTPLWLDVRALGASLAPLSGLAYALRRLPTSASPEHVLTRSDEPDQHARTALLAIRAGRAVSRRDAIVALRQFVGRSGEGGRRPLLSVDPAPLVDPSTVGVIAEAAREGGPDALIMMRLLLDSKPPEAFARGGGLAEVRVRGLSLSEARSIATSMLGGQGNELPSDLARRAVTMGGANPMAVATALRVLVAAGDIVWDMRMADDAPGPPASDTSAALALKSGFRWRRGPAGRLETMSLEALFEERIDTLAAPLRRVLEVLVTVPDPDERELATEIAQGDGLLEETWVRAVEELDVLGLLRFDSRGIALSPALRQVVHASMAPARALELHGRVARALTQRGFERDDDFGRATLAYYLAHAGQMTEAAAIFLAVAARAGQLGFLRSGVRLAAAAVECDPSDAIRARAAQIAETLSERQTGTMRASLKPSSAHGGVTGAPSTPAEQRASVPMPSDFATEAGARAVQAILARDFEEVDRALELLVAAGRDPATVDRLRTVILLAKGEPVAAALLLQKQLNAANGSAQGMAGARLSLTRALVEVANGEVGAALRGSLETLARTREAADWWGERASLSVLAICYRRLGRDADAAKLASAALALHRPSEQRAHA